jgi:hypothetical protein
MAKTWGKSEPLVAAHVKGVSVAAIEQHLGTFRKFIGHRKSGIYVLRKNSSVYYVGLASSVRRRLVDHLKDHHQGKWDWFDLYIVQESKVKYLKELETLLIRVAKPPGNKTVPNFIRHKNITKQFKQALEERVAGLFELND